MKEVNSALDTIMCSSLFHNVADWRLTWVNEKEANRGTTWEVESDDHTQMATLEDALGQCLLQAWTAACTVALPVKAVCCLGQSEQNSASEASAQEGDHVSILCAVEL